MNDTPKAAKSRSRTSLSLNKRLSKRLASPQNHMRTTENSPEVFNSPTISTINIDDCTPPHKRFNLDDSSDSPTNFEGNYSPTGFLSQTLCPDSPEVGWRWSKDDEDQLCSKQTKKHDNFAFTNSGEEVTFRRTRSDPSQVYFKKREERRQAKLAEIQRAEKIRTEALLRERLSKLEAKIKKTEESSKNVKIKKTNKSTYDRIFDADAKEPPAKQVKSTATVKPDDTTVVANFSDFDSVFEKTNPFEIPDKPTESIVINNIESLNDFLNDSDTDDFLIAATQQLESQLSKSRQPIVSASMPMKISNAKIEKSTVTQSTNRDKRSSLYMKFLEDDEDDVFASLDDAWVLKASQSNKPKSPFQRYKSMPSDTNFTGTSASKNVTITSSGSEIIDFPKWSLKNGAYTTATTNSTPMKRHSSSHAITPSTTNLRGRQLHRRD